MGGASCSSYSIVSVQAVSCCASLPRDHARRLAGVDRHHSDNTDHVLPSVHHNHRASSVGSCACSAPTTTSPPGMFMHAHHGHFKTAQYILSVSSARFLTGALYDQPIIENSALIPSLIGTGTPQKWNYTANSRIQRVSSFDSFLPSERPSVLGLSSTDLARALRAVIRDA